MKKLELNYGYYENAKISGSVFKVLLKEEVCKIDVNKFESKLPKLQAMWDKCERVFPNYMQEVKGRADGADVDAMKYWSLICREIMNIDNPCCTDVMVKTGDDIILSHNEDSGYAPNNHCISKVYENENWFCGLDYYTMPFGNLYTWNSFGIIKTVNWCNDPYENIENIPSVFAQRHISMANSLEDMIERCKAVKPAHGYHVNFVDSNGKRGASIEVYPDGTVEVRELKDFLVHSNHYLYGRFIDAPQPESGLDGYNSMHRYFKARELVERLKERTPTLIRSICEYRDKLDRFEYSIFQTLYDPYETGSNFTFSTTDKKVRIKDYIEKTEEIFDLKEKNILN